MRNLAQLLLMLSLLSACKKDNGTIPETPPPIFPESLGMNGTIGENSFEASSLNASLNYDTTAGKYELNIVGWHSGSDQTIYLHYKDFSFQPANYAVFQVSSSAADSNYAFYEKDHVAIEFGTGQMVIYNTEDTLIKGTYDFTTAAGLRIKGVYTIKPIITNE